MVTQQDIIRSALQQFDGSIKEGQGWITFEANQNEHWVEYAHSQINMDWPFGEPPEESDILAYFAAVAPIKIVGWDRDGFVMFNISGSAPHLLAPAIDNVFNELYGLGADYQLRYKIQES